VVDAHVGRVLGQSKQIVLEPEFLSLRNWVFLEAVGMQTWPLPAAVMFPSAWMLPDMVCLFIIGFKEPMYDSFCRLRCNEND
jgi:hypothetical protein